MRQAEELQKSYDEAAVLAVNEMASCMCPHRIAHELDDLVIDLVTEAPDRWDEERATMFKALRLFNRALCQRVPPRALEFKIELS